MGSDTMHVTRGGFGSWEAIESCAVDALHMTGALYMQQEQEFDGVVMTRLKTYSLAELEHLFLEFFVELTAVRPFLLRTLSSLAPL